NPDASVTTATPSVTGASDAPLPSQAALPPKQAWCPSEIFCAGKILQAINIAMPYADSKTIVDKPTNGTSQSVISTFNDLSSSGNNTLTYGEIVQFLQTSFQGEGLELDPTQLSNFPQSPAAFQNIEDPYVKGFTLEVHKIWNLLIRDTDESRVCQRSTCESSLIPLNHTFVVPGGRFREQYYWDSKFILEGLLKSELYSVANSTLQNFMDEIERFGFIPNGGRIYYLNRSQPPVFIGMVLSYYNATKDDATLERALPIMERELEWWSNNRSLSIVSPYTNQTRKVYHYSVTNTAPRPESYLEDYEAANGADLSPAYTDDQKSALYAELASGAETGWDYSTRWAKQPKYNGTIPATYIESGLQWDFPNAWPPHIFFALEALANVPSNVSQSPIPLAPNGNSWNLVPTNQLGLTEEKLPLQLLNGNNTAPQGQDINALNGTVVNGGNATTEEGWVRTLRREIANRYMTSVYCSWYATGGSIPGLLPRLPNETLALTQSTDQNGHLFEKFSALDVDSAGRGGEYAVQAGFGWTNGVLLWLASEYKEVLVRPTCPEITAESTGSGGGGGSNMGVVSAKVGSVWASVLLAVFIGIGLMV
ncbi:hypothetical protein FRC20_001168, partial [Serendipita sp. 405]